MTFYERYIDLCHKCGIKPTGSQMQQITGITSSALTQWKTLKSLPTAAILGSLAKYFKVSVDYLIGLSDESNTPSLETLLSDDERLLIEAFRMADAEGRQEIIYTCRAEKKKAEARRVREEERVSG